jgi:hypothetical protein
MASWRSPWRWDLGHIELLVEPVRDVEPRHVRGGEVQIDERVALGHPGLGERSMVPPTSNSTGMPVLAVKALADDLLHGVLPVAAPYADHQRF